MEKILMTKLESLRAEMNTLAEERGLNNPQVLALSQEIDKIHNKLNNLRKYKNNHLDKNNIIREAENGKLLYHSKNTILSRVNFIRVTPLKEEMLV